ncbi:hypothetical protein EDF24_0545 [Curtobacterium sp. PhB130]|uniref:hypothetical protein n=1 Tax=Curtobacterium sp. PhB130 TaxID=2485178 RepID=UPI000F4C9F2B|nr:hypothetical protein [Curtobacterium sp. PhB130]ROS77783.1 hypothetical protein EDF24_0545 [Curtobacterium sp. PhB130]
MRDSADVCLAVTCHDPLGRFAAGVEEAGPALGAVFGALAVNATAETHPATMAALRALDVPTFAAEHGAGTVGIGTARKDVLALGLRSASPRLFYSDLDHVLRWLSTSPDEVERCLARRDHDLLVVGRSPVAMAAAPERLRRTEELVNHVYGLANGLDERWDLMIAMRLMTRDAARTIVVDSRETSIASDVTWPMLVSASGGTVGSFDADGIRFLARDDFGEEVDRRDHDPEEWYRRMVTATAHIAAIVGFDAA